MSEILKIFRTSHSRRANTSRVWRTVALTGRCPQIALFERRDASHSIRNCKVIAIVTRAALIPLVAARVGTKITTIIWKIVIPEQKQTPIYTWTCLVLDPNLHQNKNKIQNLNFWIAFTRIHWRRFNLLDHTDKVTQSLILCSLFRMAMATHLCPLNRFLCRTDKLRRKIVHINSMQSRTYTSTSRSSRWSQACNPTVSSHC